MNQIATDPDLIAAPPAAAPAGAPSGVTVSGLYKSFGAHPVLRGLDLDVPAGSITAILGPSGSGKTTLLRLLAGFAQPDAGTITIGGRQVDGPGRHIGPRTRQVGYVPQEGCLFPHLDVRANVGFGLPRGQRRARVAELLDLTGLAEFARRYPHELSGGQQQRVALARALAPNPALVLLDEPFSSLDAFLRTSVRLDVARILGDAGTTTVIVTHDQDEALSMSDQVAILREGTMAQTGSPQAVYTRPVDTALATFIGEANLLPGTLRAGHAHTCFGPLPLAQTPPNIEDGTAIVALLRPEQLELVEFGDTEAPGTVAGAVVQCDYHGHDTVITVDTAQPGAPLSGPISFRCVGAAPLAPGARVALRATGAVTVWRA